MTLDELRALATRDAPGGFKTWPPPLGDMSVTLEDAEFLYALVGVTKPKRVIELGAGMGVSARFIAEALRRNGEGRLETVEDDTTLAAAAAQMLTPTGHLLPAEVIVGDLPGESSTVVLPWRISPAADLVFIDSGYRRREFDIATWLLPASTAIVVIHDANRQYDVSAGEGVFLPGSDGLWIGRART